MRTVFLSLIGILGFSFSVFAQNPEPAKEAIAAQRAESLEQVAAAAKEVGLDEQKTVKLKTIFENLFKKIDEIKADGSLSAEARNEKLKAANADKDWRVKDLLGDKYKAYSEVRKRLMAEAAAKKKQ